MMKRFCALLIALIMSFSFVVPATAASLSNFTKQNTYTQGQFTDVDPSAWYAECLQKAYEYGLLVGYSPTSMGPEKKMTIAEAIVLATRLHSTYYANDYIYSSEYPFTGGAWYEVYIQYAINNKIIGNGDFSDYTVNVTRAQFADIIESAFPDSELKQINTVPDGSIPDVKINDGHAKAIYHLYRAGILGGVDSSGRFNPTATISRAEVATLIARVVDPSLRLSDGTTPSNPEDELDSVSSLSNLEDYLNRNMTSCTTPMGTYAYEFTVRERTEDFIIETSHTGASPWYELEYSDSISDNTKEETLSVLRDFQKEVYRIASTAFPNTAIAGGFCDRGYKYPNIQVNPYVITALSWANHDYNGDDKAFGFYWDTSRDTYDFNSGEENTDVETDITSISGLENYLNKNLSICETPMGTYSLKFDVSENTYSFNGWDIEILTEGNYSVLPWAEINNSIKYTEEERAETLNILKNIQKEIYEIASEAFPNKKLTGCYFSDWYKYPSLEVGYKTNRHLTWTNYTSDSYAHDYNSTYITSFHWDDWRDD